MMTPVTPPINPEDFKIKELSKDKDALILIGLSVLLMFGLATGLAFLPDDAWDRLVSRSSVLWAAGLAILPTVVAIWQRYKLRQAAVQGYGVASQPTTHTMVYNYPKVGE